MELYLLRHGIATDAPPEGGTDADRPLTHDGIAKMQQAARGMKVLEIKLDALISSPLVRARQTAEIVAHELRINVQVCDALAPGCGMREFQELIGQCGRARQIMLVGHEPDLGYIGGTLIGGAQLPLKKGSLARISLYGPDATAGSLTWLLTSRVLRAVAER